MRTGKADRVVSVRVRHDAAGAVVGFTRPQVLPEPAEGTARIRDIAWRSPTTVSVLRDIITEGLSQVRTVSVDGAPGEISTGGTTTLRGRIRTLVSHPGRPRRGLRRGWALGVRPDRGPSARSPTCRPASRRSPTSADPQAPRLRLPSYDTCCWHGRVLDEALDLFLGSRCVGCDAAGPDALPGLPRRPVGRPRVAWPTPVPDGLVTPWVAEAYDGAVRALVVGHKDRGQWGHRRVLGDLLAQAVHGAAADLDPAVPLLLVPVPSRPGAGRRRGYEATEALVRRAASRVRRERPSAVAPAAGLARAPPTRPASTRGTGPPTWPARCTVPPPALARVGRRWSRAHVLVCDDVLTTGSTAREAQRALEAVGLPPVAVAAVAATRRRAGPAGPTSQPDR